MKAYVDGKINFDCINPKCDYKVVFGYSGHLPVTVRCNVCGTATTIKLEIVKEEKK